MAQLLAIALLGGVVLGAMAGLIFFPPAGFVIGGFFGLVIGFISLAIIAPALSRKDLTVGVVALYPIPILVATFSGALGPDAAIPATGAALGVCALAVHCILPNSWPRRAPGQCRVCGYDLAGITGVCPECGARVDATKRAHRWSPVAVGWLALATASLIGVSAITVPPALQRATAGARTRNPDRLMELMADKEMSVHERATRRLKEVAPELLARKALAHPLTGTRIQAARALRDGFEHDPEALHALILALNDPNENVRYEVALTLGSIGNPEALPALEQAETTDPSIMVVRAANAAVEEITQRSTNDESGEANIPAP